MADAPLGQLPRLRCGVLPGLPARLLDGLRQLLHRLAARDEHQHGVRRQLGQRLLQRAELGGLPCAHVVDQEVAGGGVEAQHRERVRHVGGLALAGVEALEPAGAALVLRAPPHAGAPGVDLGVVVAADEIGGLQLGHWPECTGGRSGAVRQRSVVTRMAPCVDRERHGAVLVGAIGRDAGVTQGRQRGGRRVAVAVVGAHLDPGDLRPEAVEHLGETGVGTAVVRDLHRLDGRERVAGGSRRTRRPPTARGRRRPGRPRRRRRSGSGPRAEARPARAAAGRGSARSSGPRGAPRRRGPARGGCPASSASRRRRW